MHRALCAAGVLLASSGAGAQVAGRGPVAQEPCAAPGCVQSGSGGRLVSDQRIERVEVYSHEARVHRVATVVLGGAAVAVALADLPAAVAGDTVRVECATAEVEHVEITRTTDRLPRQAAARELLGRLERLVDELRLVDDEERALSNELALLRAVQPETRRAKDKDRDPPALHVDAWRRVLSWVDGRAQRVHARLSALLVARRALERRLQPLRVEARRLLPDATLDAATRVVATMRGQPGRHRVTLSYLVTGVRWVPSYDLRLDDAAQKVEASYYAVVTQQSGEDWPAVRLSFSTAMPGHLVAVPELPTWTLGRRSDFTPRPRERLEPAPVAWVPPAPRPASDPFLGELNRALNGVETATARRDIPADRFKKKQRTSTYDFDDDVVEGDLVRPAGAAADARTRVGLLPREEAPPPPAGMPAPEPAPAMPMAPRPSPSPMSARAPRSRGWFRGSAPRTEPATESLPWTDTGYVPPYLDPELPAAAAQGYRFTLDAPGRHAVIGSGLAVRVPLARQRFDVHPSYRIVPGASKAAYLTARVRNSTERPILRGQATLFLGASFAGETRLETALPGAALTLALGVDDRIKVVRHLSQRMVREGVVFKDDVTEYTVTIEVANHRRYPIDVEVEDQVPVKQRDPVRIEGFAAEPAMEGPTQDGKVAWKGTIGASSVRKLTFRFRVVRPKDWEVTQYDR